MSNNHFAQLSAVNVNAHVEKKGGFSYLSWPYAVSQLRLADPTATWEVKRFDQLPYLVTEAGVFVEVAVTVQGITLSQIHPVLDGRNRPILAPNAFEINTSLQRCLVKAIALHGLGLYIYAGEDLPQVGSPGADAANDPALAAGAAAGASTPLLSGDAPEPMTQPHSVTRRTGATITGPQQAQIQRLVVQTGSDLGRLLAHFGVTSLRDLPAAEFARVVRSLENRRAAA